MDRTSKVVCNDQWALEALDVCGFMALESYTDASWLAPIAFSGI